MASVSKTKSGAARIRFRLNGEQKEIYLGKISQKVSNQFKDHIESLAIASNTSTNVPRRTIEWATGIQDDFKKKLATAGLIDLSTPDDIPTLGDFVNRWIDNRTDVKESSRLVYGRARNWLVKFFPSDKPIDSITAADAEDWRRFMLRSIEESTARRMSGVAKQVFRYAVKGRHIDENPFADLPTAVGAREKDTIERETIQTLIDAAPSAEWRLLIALARYGGLRVPSEPLALKWGDINFQTEKISLRQPKVEHHDGKERRTMPMFPELRPYLEDVLNEQGGAVSPDDDVLQKCRLTNYIPQITRIAARAGLTLSDAFFTCCRASRETELVDVHPSHVVHAWLGNSKAVADKHYLKVTEKHFQHALRMTPQLTPDTSGQQGTQQDNRPTLHRETTKENVGLPTKNGVRRKNLRTPFNGPNWT